MNAFLQTVPEHPLFNPEAYRGLLRSLADLRPFVRFGDMDPGGVILRHDVDYSPRMAAQMAQRDCELGVKATFFLLACSPLYNLFEPETLAAVRVIADCGHDVGLHYHHSDGELDPDRLYREFTALRLALPSTRRLIAWHNPEGDIGRLNSIAQAQGFVSAYDDAFFGPERYISDSNRRNSATDILAFEASSRSKTHQILLHPEIWMTGCASMGETLKIAHGEVIDRIEATFRQNTVWADMKKHR